MRILNIIQCAHLGGMEQASLRLMQALKARGHELRLISLNPIQGLGPLLAKAGIPACGLDYGKRGKFATMVDLSRVLRSEQADAMIMTGHNLAASLSLGNVCRDHRVLAAHFHHNGVMPAWRWRLIYRFALRRFQAITFPSDFVRREAVAICPAIKGISHVVRNPIEMPPRVTPEERLIIRERVGLHPQVRLVGNAGWLIPRKRFDVFLRTAAVAASRRQDIRFVIAGDGPERPSLQHLALSLGIADKVHWLGWMDDLRPFYAGLDVLLFNSDWDAFPTTPVEAMSYGVPVVASALNGGLGEIIQDESVGWLTDKHDSALLAEWVTAAMTDDGRRKGATARECVAETCDPASISGFIEGLLANKDAC